MAWVMNIMNDDVLFLNIDRIMIYYVKHGTILYSEIHIVFTWHLVNMYTFFEGKILYIYNL